MRRFINWYMQLETHLHLIILAWSVGFIFSIDNALALLFVLPSAFSMAEVSERIDRGKR